MPNPVHIRLAATAERLIRLNGRSVVLLRKSETPDDPDKPWRGSDCNDDELPVIAAVVENELDLVTGTVLRRGDKQALIAAVANQDIASYDFLIDGNARYNMDDVQTINPGETTIVFIVTLRR